MTTIEPDPFDEDDKSNLPFYDWAAFIGQIFRWRPGEHLGCIGPTGSGKTTLINALLPYRKYTTVIGTKPADDSLEHLITNDHYLLMNQWKDYSPTIYPKRVLWPSARNVESIAQQRSEILTAMVAMYRESGGYDKSYKGKRHYGGWCVVIDELWYVIHQLKLELTVKTYLQQARSIGITLVVGTQRPAFIPLEVYDQSTHLFFWRDNDETNLKRISGIGNQSSKLIKQIVSTLPMHHVLYIHTRTGQMVTTLAPPLQTGDST